MALRRGQAANSALLLLLFWVFLQRVWVSELSLYQFIGEWGERNKSGGRTFDRAAKVGCCTRRQHWVWPRGGTKCTTAHTNTYRTYITFALIAVLISHSAGTTTAATMNEWQYITTITTTTTDKGLTATTPQCRNGFNDITRQCGMNGHPARWTGWTDRQGGKRAWWTT